MSNAGFGSVCHGDDFDRHFAGFFLVDHPGGSDGGESRSDGLFEALPGFTRQRKVPEERFEGCDRCDLICPPHVLVRDISRLLNSGRHVRFIFDIQPSGRVNFHFPDAVASELLDLSDILDAAGEKKER